MARTILDKGIGPNIETLIELRAALNETFAIEATRSVHDAIVKVPA